MKILQYLKRLLSRQPKNAKPVLVIHNPNLAEVVFPKGYPEIQLDDHLKMFGGTGIGKSSSPYPEIQETLEAYKNALITDKQTLVAWLNADQDIKFIGPIPLFDIHILNSGQWYSFSKSGFSVPDNVDDAHSFLSLLKIMGSTENAEPPKRRM